MKDGPGFFVIGFVLLVLGTALIVEHVYVLAGPSFGFSVLFLVLHWTGKRRGLWRNDRPANTDREEDQP